MDINDMDINDLMKMEFRPDCKDPFFGQEDLIDRLLQDGTGETFAPALLLAAYMQPVSNPKLVDYVILNKGQGADRKVVAYLHRAYAWDVLMYLADYVEELLEAGRVPRGLRSEADKFIEDINKLALGEDHEA